MDADAGEPLIDRMERSLTNQTPSPEVIVKIEDLRLYAKNFAIAIIKACPQSRETSLALTHLEETVMWAVKSIVLE